MFLNTVYYVIMQTEKIERSEYGFTIQTETKGRHFWRDVGSECLATFLLVSVHCALMLTWTPLDSDVYPLNPGDVIQTALGKILLLLTHDYI